MKKKIIAALFAVIVTSSAAGVVLAASDVYGPNPEWDANGNYVGSSYSSSNSSGSGIGAAAWAYGGAFASAAALTSNRLSSAAESQSRLSEWVASSDAASSLAVVQAKQASSNTLAYVIVGLAVLGALSAVGFLVWLNSRMVSKFIRYRKFGHIKKSNAHPSLH